MTTIKRDSATLVWKGEEVKGKANAAMKLSVKEMALLVDSQATDLCPVMYGYLKGSINAQMNDWGTYIGVTEGLIPPIGHDVSSFKKIEKPSEKNVALVGTVVDYAPHVEYGTVRMAAQPFMRPAVDIMKGRALHIVEVNGRREFKEYIK